MRKDVLMATLALMVSCAAAQADTIAHASVRSYPEVVGVDSAAVHEQWYNGENFREAWGSINVSNNQIIAHSVVDTITGGPPCPCDLVLVDTWGQALDTLLFTGRVTATVTISESKPGMIVDAYGNFGNWYWGLYDYRGPVKQATFDITNGHLDYGLYVKTTSGGAGNVAGTFHNDDTASVTIEFDFASAVPEPTSLLALTCGLSYLFVVLGRRRPLK